VAAAREQRVRMALDQPGEHGHPRRIERGHLPAPVPENVGSRADRDDQAVADRHGGVSEDIGDGLLAAASRRAVIAYPGEVGGVDDVEVGH